MKKVCTLLLVLVVFNFIFTCFLGVTKVYALDDVVPDSFTQEDFNSMTQTGTTEVETSSGKLRKKLE